MMSNQLLVTLWLLSTLAVVASLAPWRTCSGNGDIHYITFDNAMFDYQGVCKHTLVDFCGNVSLETFQVYARAERRYGNTDVSYLYYVEIVYSGTTVRLQKDPSSNAVNVKENGVIVTVPRTTATYNLTTEPGYTVYTGPPGLIVRYNGNSQVLVTLSTDYNSTALCGVCGNYNGAPMDDFVTKTGVDKRNDPYPGLAIGDSWIVPDPEVSDSSICPTVQPPVCNPIGAWIADCDSLVNTTVEIVAGAIHCLGQVFVDKVRTDCLLDGCYSNGAAVTEIVTFFNYIIDHLFPKNAGQCSCTSLQHVHVLIPGECHHYCDCNCGYGVRVPCPMAPDPAIQLCHADDDLPPEVKLMCGIP